MSRIDSENISLGESFVIENEKNDVDNRLLSNAQILAEQELLHNKIIDDARNEAERILVDTRQKATTDANLIAEKIKKEAKEIGYKTGYDEGYQSGFKTGYVQASGEVTTSIKKDFSERLSIFNSYIKCIFDIKKRVIKSLHTEITALIVNIVDMVCLQKNSVDSQIVQRLIQHAIVKLKEKENETITLIVHPKVKKQVSDILDFIKNENKMISDIKLVEDSSLAQDGIIVETLKERIDATFSVHLKNILDRVLDDSDSFSEDNLITEYNDVFNNLEYQENSIIDTASKSEFEATSSITMETINIPEPPPLDEVHLESEIEPDKSDIITESNETVIPEVESEQDTAEQSVIENSVLMSEDLTVTYEAPPVGFMEFPTFSANNESAEQRDGFLDNELTSSLEEDEQTNIQNSTAIQDGDDGDFINKIINKPGDSL